MDSCNHDSFTELGYACSQTHYNFAGTRNEFLCVQCYFYEEGYELSYTQYPLAGMDDQVR